MTKVLIAGVPRSGTTWVGECLGSAVGARYVHEPDNELARPSAIKAKRGLGPYPLLFPGDSCPAFERLWEDVFHPSNKPRGNSIKRLRLSLAYRALGMVDKTDLRAATDLPLGPLPWRARLASGLAPYPIQIKAEHLIVKSVFLPLALEWVAWKWRPVVVVVLRHPMNIMSAWKDLDWREDRSLFRNPAIRERFVKPFNLPGPPANPTPVARAAWQLGLLRTAVDIAISRNPQWKVVDHEVLCRDPAARFRDLFAELGIPWGEEVDAYLQRSNRPGRGFQTQRVAADQTSTRWQQRLDADEVHSIEAVLQQFPVSYQPV